MKILFIYPEKENNSKGFFNLIQSYLNRPTCEPRELIRLSIQFPITWECKLVDLNAHRLKDKELEWADFVVINADHRQEESTKHIIKKCNLVGKRIIAEGTLFSSAPDRFETVDHLILNGASLHTFIFDLEEGTAKRIYLPLTIKRNRQSRPYSLHGLSSFFSNNIHTFSA